MLEYFTEINSLLIWQLSPGVMVFIHQYYDPVSTMFLTSCGAFLLEPQCIDEEGTQWRIFEMRCTDSVTFPNSVYTL